MDLLAWRIDESVNSSYTRPNCPILRPVRLHGLVRFSRYGGVRNSGFIGRRFARSPFGPRRHVAERFLFEGALVTDLWLAHGSSSLPLDYCFSALRGR